MDTPPPQKNIETKGNSNNSKRRGDNPNHNRNPQQHRNPNPGHKLTKRQPPKPCHRKNDIFVTTKTNFNAQLKKCIEIFETETTEVFLHCMGHAIRRCINLALKLVEQSNGVLQYEANTSTIKLIDDLHPLCDEDFSTRNRMNSCLHVRVFRQLPTLPTKLN